MIVAGALSVFILAPQTHASNELTQELFAEQQWQECRVECLRVLKLEPNDEVHLTSLQAGTRLGNNHLPELTSFASNTSIDQELRCEADFELARIYQNEKSPTNALRHLVSCFNKTTSAPLFAEATRKANTILNANPKLEKDHTELVHLIRTASKTWPRKTTERAPTNAPILARPALWIIGFYQSQISPAIGSRCSLHPSCSKYAVDAMKQHGAIGIAIAGDRMVREPDVVEAKARPIVISHQIKYADPISDHSFWMKEKVK